ncbi:MAG: SGNH/GDSL hydrolase family protein [Pseudomonadota bacterium]
MGFHPLQTAPYPYSMTVKRLGLAPVLLAQALWVMARASRLPEAGGDRHGTLGSGPLKRLVVIGDSSAAGVGVSHQSEALGGQLAAALAKDLSVSWQVIAKSGATVASTLRSLEALPDMQADLALIALGVNDTKNGVRTDRWQSGYTELLGTVSEKSGASRICVSGIPLLRHFPLLPSPLNEVLGARAEQFDMILRQIAESRPDTRYLKMDFPLDPENMATDGFHPSAKIYRQWAERAADAFLSPDW